MNEPITILTSLIVWLQHFFVKTTSLLLSILFTVSTGIVYANPTGGEVVSGNASISSSGNRMDINQSSDRAVLNWQDFSIGGNEQVNFNQPGKRSVALNRVVGANLSNIQGQLTANGNVFIVNRNGVVFGTNSRVDVNGLMATTSAISNADFMAGRMNFKSPGGAVGTIVNEGTITVAEGGLVAFVAPSVRNAGVINARLGKVELAAGEQFTLDMYGDDLIKVAVSDELAKQLVENSGEINADGGVVSLTASQAKSAVDDVINMSGSIQAKSVAQRDGKIILSGGGVLVAGTLDTSSDSGAGGDIDVLGTRISLSDKATLNASGAGGGGEVHIGGDYQGKGQRKRASKTRINPGAQIMADATVKGAGGRIIVWSDDHTKVDGSLSARGGQSGGDGGLIETSSAGKLDFSRQAKVEARGSGKPGTWLLDPEDITIGSGQAKAISSTLNNGGNVSIKTSAQGSGEGNIKVNAAIRKTKGGNASLSMRAHNKIDVNAPITSTSGKLNVRLKAGRSINVNAKVSTNGGGFSTSITGVRPTKPNEGNTNDTSADDSKAQDESTEDQIADNSDDAQADGSTNSSDNKPTQPKSDRSKPKADERVADQGDDKATQDAVDQVQTTVATTDVAVTVPEPVTPTPQVITQTPEPTRINTAPPATVATTATVPAVVEPKADPSPVKRPAVGITINKGVNSGGGSIAIDAGNNGTATINNQLDASNTQSGKVGGEIKVLGNKVVLTKKAKLDASGDAGGGDVKVGGAYQGKGDTRTAKTTTVNKSATIKSNAITNGDGGEVVVWADKSTDYQGHIEAKGGKQGGDGGLVEVSGKQNLKFNGTVDTSAPKGKTGTLLLDPEDLAIKNTNTNIYKDNELSWKDLNDLGANNNVNVKVDGKIGIEKFNTGTVTLVHGLGKEVSFEAGGDITFADTTDTLETSGANLKFISGSQLVLGNLFTHGGKVDLTADGDISLQKINTVVDPNATLMVLDAGGAVEVNNPVDINPQDDLVLIAGKMYIIPNANGTSFIDSNFELPEDGVIKFIVDFGGSSVDVKTNLPILKGGEVNVNSNGDKGVILNGSIHTGTADINIKADNGMIVSTNQDVVLDTSILGEVIGSSGRFQNDRLSSELGVLSAGTINMKAKKISLFDRVDFMPGDPSALPIPMSRTGITLDNANIIASNYELTATEGDGNEIEFIDSNDDIINLDFDINGTCTNCPDVIVNYKTNADPALKVRILDAGSTQNDQKSILRIGNVSYDLNPFEEFGSSDQLYSGGPLDGTVFARWEILDGVSGISAQQPINVNNNAASTISCPPCIAVEPPNPDPPLPPDPPLQPEPPVVIIPPTVSPGSAVSTPVIVDNRPSPAPDSPPAEPQVTTIESIDSSAEIDRDSDRRLIRSVDEGEVGVSTLTDDECAAFDALNWLASGPRDATSSVDLGRSSGQSSQSDIARMAACLTRDSQVSL